jgi:type VI secretion system protein ImpH
LKIADYERFLPGGESLTRLVDWVRNYVRDGLDWDLNLHLRQEDVPRLKLGRHARLGYTAWMLSGAAAADQRQLRLHPAGAAGRPRGATLQPAREAAQDASPEPQTLPKD